MLFRARACPRRFRRRRGERKSLSVVAQGLFVFSQMPVRLPDVEQGQTLSFFIADRVQDRQRPRWYSINALLYFFMLS